jgi:hypothetical protein
MSANSNFTRDIRQRVRFLSDPILFSAGSVITRSASAAPCSVAFLIGRFPRLTNNEQKPAIKRSQTRRLGARLLRSSKSGAVASMEWTPPARIGHLQADDSNNGNESVDKESGGITHPWIVPDDRIADFKPELGIRQAHELHSRGHLVDRAHGRDRAQIEDKRGERRDSAIVDDLLKLPAAAFAPSPPASSARARTYIGSKVAASLLA